MKKIKTVDAVGYVLQHDITQILPGEFKGRAFKKGDRKSTRLNSSHVI